MAKGFQTQTVDLGQFNLDDFLAQQRLAMQAPKGKKNKKGFLLDQVSTGGGIGGALAGGAAGAAVGSAVPIVGTAIGGILGALLGGGAGSAAGEVTENAITGDALGTNVGKEALIGGVTSLPIGAGLKLAQAGLKGATGVGKTGARELIEQAGAKTVPGAVKAPIASNTTAKAGKSLENLGGKMLASQSQVTGAQARKMGIRPVETLGRVNQRTGLTNLDDMAEVGRGLTGAGEDSILDVLTREAVGSTSGVKLPNLQETVTKLLDDKGTLLTDSMRKDVLRNVKNAGATMYGGSKGSLAATANPQEALNQANKFRAAAQNIKTRSLTATPEQADMAKVYDGLASTIEDALYKSPGVNGSIKDLSRFGATSLREMAGEARVAGNTAQADAFLKIADELGGVKNVSELRKLKKDFVDIGKIDNATAQAEGARAFNSEDALSLMRKNPVTGTLGAAMNGALPQAAGTLTKAGRALQNAPQGAARANQALLPLAARQAGGRLLTTEQTPSELPQEQVLPGEAQVAGIDPMAGMTEEPSVGGFTQSQIEAAMVKASMDPKGQDAFAQLKALYAMLPQQTGPDLSSSTAQLVAKQATGETSLNQLEGAFNAAGGGQGSIGGGIAQALGNLNLNAEAGTYNDQVAGTARQLSRAMGEVGAGSDSDAQAYISMLPRLTDSPERAAQKIALLRERLAAARQNTMLYGSGASSEIAA